MDRLEGWSSLGETDVTCRATKHTGVPPSAIFAREIT